MKRRKQKEAHRKALKYPKRTLQMQLDMLMAPSVMSSKAFDLGNER